MGAERLTDLTYEWLATRPTGAYHIKDIWAAMAQEYPDRFGVTDHRKTPHDTLRVMMMREGDRFVRVGPNRYFILTKAMTERPKEEARQEETVFTDKDFYGAGLDRVVLAYQKTRDSKLAERILKSVTGMIIKEVKDYVRYNLPEEDLIQEASIGVLRAIETYDPKKNAGAATHIRNYIWGYVTRYYENNFSLIRSNKNTPQRKMIYRRGKFIEYKDSKDGERRDEIITNLIKETGLTEEQVLVAGEHTTSVFIPLGSQFHHQSHDDEEGLTLEEILASDDPTAEEIYEEADFRSKVMNALRTHLTEREIYVLEKRYLDEDPLTLEEVGQAFDLTRERVRQIEAKALEKVRKRFSTWLRVFS